MKLLFCVHGYPPELYGGTENATRELARALARSGEHVLVATGSMASAGDEPSVREEDGVRVHTLARGDLYFDHWQKSNSPGIGAAWRELLQRERPDLVHVQHWLRLTDELVLGAARQGIPAVLSLHDHFASCLLVSRAHPKEGRPCEREAGALECVRCAVAHPPRTPWIPLEHQLLAFEARRGRLATEARLARRRVVPSRSHAQALQRWAGPPWSELEYEIIPPLRRSLSPAERKRLAAPHALGVLRLGSWGHTSAVKGLDLLRQAVALAGAEVAIELVSAGPLAGGTYSAESLAEHPVSQVHAMVAPSLAPESYGVVLDEARELGLPAVLPRAGAFVERAQEGAGVLFHEPGDVRDLARVLLRLSREAGLLDELLGRLPRPGTSDFELGVDQHRRLYSAVVQEGPPAAGEVPEAAWFDDRMRAAECAAWDEACSRTPAAEMGLDQREP